MGYHTLTLFKLLCNSTHGVFHFNQCCNSQTRSIADTRVDYHSSELVQDLQTLRKPCCYHYCLEAGKAYHYI
jgi:hypothetical protein